MNLKKLARKILPSKLIPASEVVFRKARLGASHLRYGLPAKNLRIIAITGTNGKTSTCCFLNDVLRSAGYTTALYTTAVIEMAGERKINTQHTTVPTTANLFRFLATAKAKKVDFVILEATSHALHQHKMWAIPVEIAVMTNLTQDHLDYHGTMKAYAAEKAKLFGQYMHPKWCVLNSDDSEWYEYFRGASTGKIFTYGTDTSSDLRISTHTESSSGLKLRLDSVDSSIVASAPVIGLFNAYNLAAVAACTNILGIAPDVVREALGHVQGVPGRMEMVRASAGFTVVVDYAHAPDALEKALEALQTVCTGKVRVVFGCTGDRDKSKRPIMGAIAVRLADQIYLTDDETYTEDGALVRAEVMAGIVGAGGKSKAAEIADRYEAITAACRDAKKGDMILLAGIGHQNYRNMGGVHEPWNEAEIVRSIMAG
jgi:UDP-N-acetylmuramoyl-L-alanyl-D-glutamate--2,6-diaminopimelate ligase